MSTAESQPSRWHQAFRAITTGNSLIAVLSVVLALIAGSILIAVTDDGVQAAAGYFFARPGDTFVAIWEAASGAYVALFQGAIYNTNADTFAAGIRPLTESL
jgi:simple sugar transport system permease protein